jgi:hypothetical protein
MFRHRDGPVSRLIRGATSVAYSRAGISGVARVAHITSLWNPMALTRDKTLFLEFGEPGAAVFQIEAVQYVGHDRTPIVSPSRLAFLPRCKT